VDSGSIRTPSTEVRAEQERLARLKERLAHELMDDEERQEFKDQVIRLRRRLGL
jgi:hypothetical protein